MLFNIKLKTKNGNDVKKKQTITVFFRLKFKKGLTTTAEYTYRIIYGNGVQDPKRVLTLKDTKTINTFEGFTLRVLLNLCHIVANISKINNLDPDFILFISPDLTASKNNSWMYLKSIFYRPVEKKDEILNDLLKKFDKAYDSDWDVKKCFKHGFRKEELDLLKEFVDRNPNTKFMSIDPNHDPQKYSKSLIVCQDLQDRLDRKPGIFQQI